MAAYVGNWHYPTEILFGAGRVQELSHVCQQFGIERPLFVTDPGLRKMDFVQHAFDQTRKNKIKAEIFSDIKSNPTGANITAGVAAYRQDQCDAVIGIGGGSALDAAKAIALMVGQSRPLWDFEDVGDHYLRANAGAIARVIAIPTTAGTGSEVGRASVIVDEASYNKKIIFHPLMQPRLVIADPELTLGLPPELTAATGMDALAHNLEAFCSPLYHPMADGIALEGMRLIKENLITAVQHGGHLPARTHMLAAAMMGATAFQKGLGAIHSLSHPVGGRYDKHHGLLNAIFMSPVLVFNRPVIEDKLQQLANYLQLPSVDALLDWVRNLSLAIKIPKSLQDIGVGLEEADLIAELAYQDPSTATNPRELSVAALREIFVKA